MEVKQRFRFSARVPQMSEDRRRDKEIRHANCEGRKMLVDLILDSGESLSLSIKNLEEVRMAKLKPHFHLEAIDISY